MLIRELLERTSEERRRLYLGFELPQKGGSGLEGLGQVRGNVLCSILPMTLAERDNHLHFMEAHSEVKRGKVTLSPGLTAGPEVGWDLNSKLL